METTGGKLRFIPADCLENGRAFVEEALFALNERSSISELDFDLLKEQSLIGNCLFASIEVNKGLVILCPDQGWLFVYALWLKPGVNKGLFKGVARELIELAEEKGFNGVRFRTERGKGMERALKTLGFKIISVEMAVDVRN